MSALPSVGDIICQGKFSVVDAWEGDGYQRVVVERIAGGHQIAPPALDFGPSWRDTSEEGTSKGRREAIFTNIPAHALIQLARVHGNSVVPKEGEEAKYADVEPGKPNWSLGCPWSWMLDALWRHLLAWQAGADNDPESGLSNLAHVLWMACTLMEYQHSGIGSDDRLVIQREST